MNIHICPAVSLSYDKDVSFIQVICTKPSVDLSLRRLVNILDTIRGLENRPISVNNDECLL